jgi:hypothetical protein
VKVGDLVRYFNTAYWSNRVGIIVRTEHGLNSIKVHWSDHTPSSREWYTEFELRKL